MKKFNLDEYLANPAMKIMTKDGRNARIICTDKIGNYPIVALIKSQTIDEEIAYSFTKDGCWSISSTTETINDLFFVPEKHEGWINIYRDPVYGNPQCGSIFDSEEAAKRGSSNSLATIKIEWEE